ncbi:flagellar biosynthesis protein FlhB [Bowmanella sp. JS7-9]|uniref:Flagellar biosynthetic protein FlhB n=1 Tax=Pseudobowmanella zhangzhouensis TaxID=1537679 RepID=A0ABW1XH24_9ALTE|nr:flagellar biosynthesis protein FlhB [Bowmanella sp. JS7-9]TBX25847.1 flagellar biosynthesis protein FlhB [Bowmanella sp. JS7-9]
MAADDAQERTEDPTEKKKSKALEKGQIARSRELSTTLVLIASAAALLLVGRGMAEALFRIFQRAFNLSREETWDMAHAFQILPSVLGELVIPMAFYMVIVVIAGVYGNIALGGYNFTWKTAKPDFSKLNPLKGLKRMFGPNGAVELIKAAAKFIVVAVSAYLALRLFQDEVLHLDLEMYPRNLVHSVELVGWMFLIICCAMIPIAIFDVPWSKHKHDQQMKMTKQEVKDERKNAEGDPQIKGRIRRLQYQAAAKRMMQAVPKADVVVTNPTHYSVALVYDQSGNRAPVVVAKGADELAMHIRKIAAAHDIPLVASPLLARAIYYSTEADHEIPEQLFMAVAQLLAYVYQLKAWRRGKAKRPKPLNQNLPIPPEFRF